VIVADMDFAPLSIALVERRDFYPGRTNRWSQHPGSFERHLQRREGNPIFAKEVRFPSNEEIRAARQKDEANFKVAEESAREWVKGVTDLLEGRKATVGGVASLHKSAADVMATCAEAGENAEYYRNLVRTMDNELASGMVKALGKYSSEADERTTEEKLCALRDLNAHHFWVHISLKDGPIRSDEITATLLCESLQTVQEVVVIAKGLIPKALEGWYQEAVVLADRAKDAKFDIPAIEQKLAILGNAVQGR
jgi:hypothetical protein